MNESTNSLKTQSQQHWHFKPHSLSPDHTEFPTMYSKETKWKKNGGREKRNGIKEYCRLTKSDHFSSLLPRTLNGRDFSLRELGESERSKATNKFPFSECWSFEPFQHTCSVRGTNEFCSFWQNLGWLNDSHATDTPYHSFSNCCETFCH